MNNRQHAHTITALLAATLLLANHGLHAETDSTLGDTGQDVLAGTTNTETSSSGAVVDHLSQEFADFLGGEEQAREVIVTLRDNGLQSPATETVADTTTGGPTTDNTTTDDATTAGDTPTGGADTPTGDMISADTGTDPVPDDQTTAGTTEPAKTLGYGEIRHTLKLAQAELDKLGITQPSDTELNAMLYGGDINGTTVDGVLALRADGMGWGQIAQAYGYRLGELVGNGQAKSDTASTKTRPAAATSHTAKVSTAGGYIPSGGSGHGYGRGLVSANGGPAGVVSSKAQGEALGHVGAGQGQLARAGGNLHSAAGGLSSAGGAAMGNAQGLAKGHAK